MKTHQLALVVGLALTVGSTSARSETNQFPVDPRVMRAGLLQAVEKAFDMIDTSQDGYISWTEASVFAKAEAGDPRRMDRATWARTDRNKDGRISRAEFSGLMMRAFDGMANAGR